MNKIDSLINRIELMGGDYSPGQQVDELLKTKVLVPIIAPFAVGKNSIMMVATKINPAFGYVKGFTTRPQRNGDGNNTYKFIKHDEEGLNWIIKGLQSGSIVQAVVHPTNHYVYGSDIESYSADYNVLDVLTTSMDEFVAMSYKDIIPIYIVCPVKDWLARIETRAQGFDATQIVERWQEAKISLEWAIKHYDSVAWVNNADDRLTNAAKQVLEIAQNNKHHDYNKEIELAHKMLSKVNEKLI